MFLVHASHIGLPLKRLGIPFYTFVFFSGFLVTSLQIHAEALTDLSKGQTIYVMAYSHFYSGRGKIIN